jgi:hypothetical protein
MVVVTTIYSQTNKIGPEGSVGIGTTSPVQKLHVEDGAIGVGNQSDDNWLLIQQTQSDGYGYDFQHNNAAVIVNEQGSINEAIVIGDVDGHLNNVLFGVAHKNGNNPWVPKLTLTGSGRLGIGTPAPTSMLDVRGTINATEIKVQAQTADFVFKDNYHLKDLSEVEAFIKTNKHLPEIPSAAEMEEQGVNLAEMNKLLLMKVEELTLYTIQQESHLQY